MKAVLASVLAAELLKNPDDLVYVKGERTIDTVHPLDESHIVRFDLRDEVHSRDARFRDLPRYQPIVMLHTGDVNPSTAHQPGVVKTQ